VKLRRYLLCGCVVACHGMACVLYAVHSAQHTTHTHTHLLVSGLYMKIRIVHKVRVFIFPFLDSKW